MARALLVGSDLVDEDLVEPGFGEGGDEVEVAVRVGSEGDGFDDVVGAGQAEDLGEVLGVGQLGEGCALEGAVGPPSGR